MNDTVGLDAVDTETYEVWQDEDVVASSNNRDEAIRYAVQYVADGPVELYQVIRIRLCSMEKKQ